MKRIVLLVIVVSLLQGCSKHYYQVYEAKPYSENITSNDTDLYFEDDNCKISYNFWAEGGNSNFTFYNKTNKVICLDLSKVFFVENGFAEDYNLNFLGTKIVNGIPSTHNKKLNDNEVIYIPPKTKRVIKGLWIINSYMEFCPLYVTGADVKEGKNIHNFTLHDNSPLIFDNIIMYSFEEEPNKTYKINNQFYISKIINLREKDIMHTQILKQKLPCYEKSYAIKDKVFNTEYTKPNMFYIKYDVKNYYNE